MATLIMRTSSVGMTYGLLIAYGIIRELF